MAFAHKLSLGIVNCLTGEFKQGQSSPFVIGSGAESDITLNDDSILDQHCVIEKTKKGIQIRSIQPEHPDGNIVLDGNPTTMSQLKARTEHSIQIGKSFLIVVTTMSPKKENIQMWGANIKNGGWIINKSNKAAATRPLQINEVFDARDTMGLDPDSTPVFKGGSEVGFYLRQLMVLEPPREPSIQEVDDQADHEPIADRVDNEELESPSMTKYIDSDSGEFTCPTCWLKFDRGDVMHVAVHDSLFGDPLLGEEQMKRFHATRFNDRGQALDDYGIPCTEIACPHCRRTLPPGFFDEPHKIFSIVGAPQSGKSYYLTVLIKLLQTTLFREFGVVFRDADPTGNAPINEMKSHLFSAQNSAQAFLTKTQLEGSMYERLPRYDRMVTLPKPFIYSLSGAESDDENCSVVFYDNAGEHFQPGQDSSNSPGAQHIASSDAIFFLFDPTINPDFRRSINDSDDPQFKSQVSDQQDIILAETEVRIKKLLGLGRREKVQTPLAIIIGKCDSWINKIGSDNLKNPIVDGTLDMGAVESNSKLVRGLMEEHCPYVVANAERISSEVCYFAASAFGHTPVTFEDDKGVTRIGPDPQKINPMYVEIPTLWALSRVQPGLVPFFK
ncbi:MAG: FHA domain-containing protein [Verrucomicrobiota bacterium]|nr:FHA domain-containing protein [Verrucomicrobiota bacterium]